MTNLPTRANHNRIRRLLKYAASHPEIATDIEEAVAVLRSCVKHGADNRTYKLLMMRRAH